jgi:hypothetical protein
VADILQSVENVSDEELDASRRFVDGANEKKID